MIYLDTSVLVAVAQVQHQDHAACRNLWNSCTRDKTATSAHTLAELYSSLTSMPPVLRLRPRDAVRAIEIFLARLTPISLGSSEYLDALGRAEDLGMGGGIVYDLLHVACARKCGAEQIFTLNLKHSRTAAPELADRIQKPQD